MDNVENVSTLADAHTIRANRAFDECAQNARAARQHELAEARRAHDILQALFVAQGRLPNNLYMAMTYLHVEIVAGTATEAGFYP